MLALLGGATIVVVSRLRVKEKKNLQQDGRNSLIYLQKKKRQVAEAVAIL